MTEAPSSQPPLVWPSLSAPLAEVGPDVQVGCWGLPRGKPCPSPTHQGRRGRFGGSGLSQVGSQRRAACRVCCCPEGSPPTCAVGCRLRAQMMPGAGCPVATVSPARKIPIRVWSFRACPLPAREPKGIPGRILAQGGPPCKSHHSAPFGREPGPWALPRTGLIPSLPPCPPGPQPLTGGGCPPAPGPS